MSGRPTRGRDIEAILKNNGVERGTYILLVEYAERLGMLEKGIGELATLLDTQSTIISNFTAVAGNMKNTIERMQRLSQDDDLPPTAA